jgi:hypothetical protein
MTHPNMLHMRTHLPGVPDCLAAHHAKLGAAPTNTSGAIQQHGVAQDLV